MRRHHLYTSIFLFTLSFHSTASQAVEPGSLSVQKLATAAQQAGFRVVEISADIPEAAHSRISFIASSFDDPALVRLREKYQLEKVVAKGSDEWTRQLLLREWVHKAIPEGTPKISYQHALDILEQAARGETFWCTHYTISYAECALALGWQARKIGVDRKHGPEGMGSEHHGVAEVWSNQFRKWVVIDAQSDLHFEKAGIPLSAWEIRREWLNDGGKSVQHIVGVSPRATQKNPAIVFWQRPEDETSIYFWLYIDNRVVADQTETNNATQLIFPQDGANQGLIWYQNGSLEEGGSQPHQAYSRNRFVPTRRLEDAYWTVGIVEATLTQVRDRSIELSLDSYCPSLTGYQVSFDGVLWEPVRDKKRVVWPLRDKWNSLRLRTVGHGNVTGPPTSLLMFLESDSKP